MNASAQDLSEQQPDDAATDALRRRSPFKKALQEATATRPEILEADAQIAAARKGILIARRSSLPSLTLSLSPGYFDVRTRTGKTRIDEPQAIVGLSIPLEDAALAHARDQQGLRRCRRGYQQAAERRSGYARCGAGLP